MKPIKMAGLALLAAATLAGSAGSADALDVWYVGVDGQRTLTTGSYAGLANPNYGRLTLLYAHYYLDNPNSNHFHGIGTWVYSGPAGNPVINSTNANNRIPELGQRAFPTGQEYLPLLPGSGAWAGKFVSGLDGGAYSNLRIKAVSSLATSTDPNEQVMWNRTNARWGTNLTGASIALQLMDITPGLNVATQAGVPIVTGVGTFVNSGQGADLDFTPVFWIDENAPVGRLYSATFRLLDLGTGTGYQPWRDSGTFTFDFQVVPEPGSMVTLASGLFGFGALALRRKG